MKKADAVASAFSWRAPTRLRHLVVYNITSGAH